MGTVSSSGDQSKLIKKELKKVVKKILGVSNKRGRASRSGSASKSGGKFKRSSTA